MLENGEKIGSHPIETPIRAIGRELLSSNWISQTGLCMATGLPPWKISRLFKRLELLGFIEAEEEPRFTRGRPRKLYRPTASGIEYFRGLLEEARDEGNAPSVAVGGG